MPRIPYGKIIRRTWRRENFKELGPIRRDLLSYLWTGPEAEGIPALYFITPGTIATDLGHSERKVKVLLRELVLAGFIKYDAEANIIFLQKQVKLDAPDNANVVIGWLKRLPELPETPLINDFLESIEPYVAQWDIQVSKHYKKVPKAPAESREPLGERLPEPLPEPSPNPSSYQNHNQNQEPYPKKKKGSKKKKVDSAVEPTAAHLPASKQANAEKEDWKTNEAQFDAYKDFMATIPKLKEKIYRNVLQKIHYAELGPPDKLWSNVVFGTMVKWVRENPEQARSALTGNFNNSWLKYIDWWLRNDWKRMRAEIDKNRGMTNAEEQEYFRKKELSRGVGGGTFSIGDVIDDAMKDLGK